MEREEILACIECIYTHEMTVCRSVAKIFQVKKKIQVIKEKLTPPPPTWQTKFSRDVASQQFMISFCVT